MEDVVPIQSELKEAGPVEVLPGAELEVDQHGQHGEDNGVRYVFFVVHAVRSRKEAHLW
jgi:hypothetical protein